MLKLTNRNFIFFCLFFNTTFNVDCVNLEDALSEKSSFRITTITRSFSNVLVTDTEKEIIHLTLKSLIDRALINFDQIIVFLKKDVTKYINISSELIKLKSAPETKSTILKKRLRKDLSDLKISLLDEQIDALAKELVTKEKWDKECFKILKDRTNDFWDMLSGYQDNILEIPIEKYFSYTDKDILDILPLEQLSFYQAIKEVKNAIQKTYPHLYNNIEAFDPLYEMLKTYYQNQCSDINSTLKEINIPYPQSITILVTNEYFWGKVPFSTKEIQNLFCSWSAQLKDTIYCTNFLIRDDNVDILQSTQIKEITTELRKLHIPEDYNKSLYKDKPFQDSVKNKLFCLMDTNIFNSEEPAFLEYLNYLEGLLSVKGTFKNESMIFFNGKLLTTYDKATYFKEQDKLLKEYLYKFGNGLDKIVDQKIFEANVVHKYVSTQICRDLTAEIRAIDDGAQRFHILQSNTIKFDGSAIPKRVEYVIHANFGSPGAIYKRANNLAGFTVSKEYMWDPVGPFDFHIAFKLGSSIYNIQTLYFKR